MPIRSAIRATMASTSARAPRRRYTQAVGRIGYAMGDDPTGAGELVVQTRTATDAQATANGMTGDGLDVTTNGDLLIVQDSSYAAIQSVVTANGW